MEAWLSLRIAPVKFLCATLVDTDLSTTERSTKNEVEPEKTNLSHLCLKYEARCMPDGIRSFLPKSPIIKKVDQRLLVGRSKNADVFLNDQCMSRNYIEIWAASNDSQTYFLKNVSQNKSVQIDGISLRYGELGVLRDKCELVLDYITFAVSVKPGDEDGEYYILSTECCDDIGNRHDIYTIRGDLLPTQELFTGFTLIPGYPISCKSGMSFKLVNGKNPMSTSQNGQILGQFPSISPKSSFVPNNTVSVGSLTSRVESSQVYNFTTPILSASSPEELYHIRHPEEHSMSQEKVRRFPSEGLDIPMNEGKGQIDYYKNTEHY
ncbi:uncharacterized protein LOC118763929 isoform X1 [Octopus sinensis]|uniref:Uncharacterized protein LOC118763929 isoform X1 n=1 Tax=Octopus sinensis TaxID=2607531 RepID=A0A7E6EVZ3_9MOLL|nr:uncharacterized protein LOC118763929 isoform X1 [Octopus sinensis]